MKRHRNLTMLLKALFFLLCLSVKGYSQPIHPLEPAGKHYKTIGGLSTVPDPARLTLDTIQYPWEEYSKGALANSLMRTYYLSLDDEKKLSALVKLPANSSAQTRADLDQLLALQNKRTKDEIKRVEYIANIGSWPNIINPIDPDYAENRKQLFYIAGDAGDWYNDQKFPATTQLLLNCIQDIRATEFRLKRYFKRPRPYHLEPRLQPLARINSPSFPSGHSLWAFSTAFLLGEIIPEKREEFLNKAEEVRWSRELMGIHYPSDNEASRIVSWNLLQYWFNSPEFIADLEKAKIELRRYKEDNKRK